VVYVCLCTLLRLLDKISAVDYTETIAICYAETTVEWKQSAVVYSESEDATNKDIFEIFSQSGSQAIIEFYALVNLKPQ